MCARGRRDAAVSVSVNRDLPLLQSESSRPLLGSAPACLGLGGLQITRQSCQRVYYTATSLKRTKANDRLRALRSEYCNTRLELDWQMKNQRTAARNATHAAWFAMPHSYTYMRSGASASQACNARFSDAQISPLQPRTLISLSLALWPRALSAASFAPGGSKRVRS